MSTHLNTLTKLEQMTGEQLARLAGVKPETLSMEDLQDLKDIDFSFGL